MGITDQLEYIKSSVSERIGSIDRKRIQYRRKSFFSFMSTSVLAAIATVLLGLNLPNFSEGARILSLIITAFISIINAFNSFFNHKELWIANNVARNKFKELQFEIEYFERSGQVLDVPTLDSFKQKYQNILDELNNDWFKYRSEP